MDVAVMTGVVNIVVGLLLSATFYCNRLLGTVVLVLILLVFFR
jgi:hypothetical protein